MRILIAAGGSGGHLIPAQQLAQALLPHAEILFGGHGLHHSAFFHRDRYSFSEISSAPLNRPFSFARNMAKGIWQSMRLLRSFRPDLIVGFGSFHSAPLLFAGALLRKRMVLFEANCQLGKVNRLFAPFAHRVAMQFAISSARSHFCLVPLLPWEQRQEQFDREGARKELGLYSDRTTFLIFGGSQGASFLNRMVPDLVPSSAQVIHLTGKGGGVEEISALYRTRKIHALVKEFESTMPKAYAAADCAICRSGAGTVAELIAHELPALLIPFPYATEDHQRANAEFLSNKVGGATILCQEKADAGSLRLGIEQLLAQLEPQRAALRRYRLECEGRSSLKEVILTDVVMKLR